MNRGCGETFREQSKASFRQTVTKRAKSGMNFRRARNAEMRGESLPAIALTIRKAL